MNQRTKNIPRLLYRALAPCFCLIFTSCPGDKGLGKDLETEAPVEQQGLGLIGGGNTGTEVPLAYTFDPEADPVPITGLPVKGEVASVAIDADGTTGILGGKGFFGSPPIAHTVNVQESTATTITSVGSFDEIKSVAINETGTTGLLGGDDGAGVPTAYNVTIASSSAAPITSLPLSGEFSTVAINTDGTTGLLGGFDFTTALAHRVDLTTNVATSLIPDPDGAIESVAIDASGTNGLLGGADDFGPTPLAYKVVSATATAISFPGAAPTEAIRGVAINRAGTTGLLGGSDTSIARAYTLDMSGITAVEIPGLAADGTIRSVAIDTAGAKGLLGGDTTSSVPIAYAVDIATNTAIAVSGLPAEGIIHSVEIQDNGDAGLLGGQGESMLPVAFLVTGIQSGSLTTTSLPLLGAASPGAINSVSFDSLVASLTHIETRGLSGNNLTLAEYLNTNAPDTAASFLPSTLAGKLGPALESASPARNAATLFSADNALFSIAQGISRRARDARQFRRFEEKEQKELALLAANSWKVTNCPCEVRLNNLWGEVIGLVAHQDRQHETPGFDPWSIGALVAYDVQKTKNFRGGLGLAYAYTYLDFDKGNGHSNVNQEYLSLYGLWNRHNLYGNLALWFGLFQTNNERNMHLTDFEFQATSFASGYQFDPHVEIGYDYDFCDDTCTFEPFVTVDWIHNWQDPYREYSSSAFKFFRQNIHCSMLRTEVGFRVYEEFEFRVWNLVLQQNISYLYKDAYSIGNVKGFLIGAPGTLILDTLSDSEHFGSVAFSMLFDPKRPKYPTGRLGYKGEFGSSYRSHQITASTEWSF